MEGQSTSLHSTIEDDHVRVTLKKLSVDDHADQASWRIDTSVCDDSVGHESAVLFSPLGAGIMSMTPTASSIHNQRDDWQGIESDDAASLRASTPQEAACVRTRQSGAPLGRIHNSTLKPLDASEKRICLESFRDRYAEKGGFPIREAIDLYHAVGTGHVNFSKVWMLVDPDSVCKIGRDRFCAFIAVVNCIAEQGDRVRLPTKALTEEEIAWLAGCEKAQGAHQESFDEQQERAHDTHVEGALHGKVAAEVAGDVFYDVPLESSWRTAVHGDDGDDGDNDTVTGAMGDRQLGGDKKHTQSKNKTKKKSWLAKLSLRNKV